MAFSKPELELIDAVVGGLCRKLNQPKLKELSIEYRIEKHDILYSNYALHGISQVR
jgi:hypothetical protein